MRNIYEDYLSILDYDIYETLSTYESLFRELEIDICDYEDYFRFDDWNDAENLQETLKKILLYKAQEEGIIPDDVDIDDGFSLYKNFAIISSEAEDAKKVVADFEDWCGIKMGIV